MNTSICLHARICVSSVSRGLSACLSLSVSASVPVGASARALDGRVCVCMRAGWGGGGGLQTVIVWDVTGGQPLQTLRGHAHAVVAGALVPGSDKLFTGGFDGEVLVWTRDTGLLGYLKVPLPRGGPSLLNGCDAGLGPGSRRRR